MNRHQLTYIDMYPQPIASAEPSGFAVWCGAACALCAVYLLTVLVFSL